MWISLEPQKALYNHFTYAVILPKTFKKSLRCKIDTVALWIKIISEKSFKKGELLVWSQCEYSCEGLLWYVLSILSPPEGFPESPRHRCHEGSRRSTHRGCVPNRSTSPTSAGCVEEGSHLCTQINTINNYFFKNLLPLIQDISVSAWQQKKRLLTHIPSANKHRDHVRFTQLRVPVFHKLEELAEGVTFLKDMRVTRWIMGKETLWFQFIAKPSYPCTLKRHLPWCVVIAVHNHAHLGGTALELDNLKDWYTTNTPADTYLIEYRSARH